MKKIIISAALLLATLIYGQGQGQGQGQGATEEAFSLDSISVDSAHFIESIPETYKPLTHYLSCPYCGHCVPIGSRGKTKAVSVIESNGILCKDTYLKLECAATNRRFIIGPVNYCDIIKWGSRR